MFDLEFFVDRSLLNQSFIVEIRINTRVIGNAEQEVLRRMKDVVIQSGTSGTVWKWQQMMVNAQQLLWMHQNFKPSNLAPLRQRTDKAVMQLIEQMPQVQPVLLGLTWPTCAPVIHAGITRAIAPKPTLCLVMPAGGEVIDAGITQAITPTKKRKQRKGKPAGYQQVDLEVA